MRCTPVGYTPKRYMPMECGTIWGHRMPPNTPPAKWLIIHDKHELLGIPLGNIGAVISGVYAIGETFFS